MITQNLKAYLKSHGWKGIYSTGKYFYCSLPCGLEFNNAFNSSENKWYLSIGVGQESYAGDYFEQECNLGDFKKLVKKALSHLESQKMMVEEKQEALRFQC